MSEWADVFGGQLRVGAWETWEEIRPRRDRDENRVAALKLKMRAEQFDELVDSLDVPDETPNLERAFKRERSFTPRS